MVIHSSVVVLLPPVQLQTQYGYGGYDWRRAVAFGGVGGCKIFTVVPPHTSDRVPPLNPYEGLSFRPSNSVSGDRWYARELIAHFHRSFCCWVGEDAKRHWHDSVINRVALHTNSTSVRREQTNSIFARPRADEEVDIFTFFFFEGYFSIPSSIGIHFISCKFFSRTKCQVGI